MSSQPKVQERDEKREWITPRVDRIGIRDAESSHGAIADGGGGNQGS